MVLSDDTIRDLMSHGKLVVEGIPDNARYGSYRFTAAKLYHGGEEGKVVDFTSASADEHDVINPGEYVWVRMREKVSLPEDITAFWWQTNRLSRKGLILMNMSVVEPGYGGPLSCLFVNFGQLHISIHKDQPLAKLVFLKLDKASSAAQGGTRIYKGSFADYDRDLHNEALQRPATFLQVSHEMTENFRKLDQQSAEAIMQIESENARLLKQSKEEFERNIPAAIRKSAYLASGILAILVLISVVTPWIQNLFRDDLDTRLSTMVQNELAQRVLLQGTISGEQDSTQQELLNKLQQLEQRLTDLERPGSQ